MIPEGKLRVESFMSNPPQPIGFHVIADGSIVAVLSADTVRKTLAEYDLLQREFAQPKEPP